MDIQVILERHDQKIQSLERSVADLKSVQAEIRAMIETLVMLAMELKHTNQVL